MAMGAYRAAAEVGLRIPRDLSVVGYDNMHPVVTGLVPGLTTVQLPHYEMGVWAARQLLALTSTTPGRARAGAAARAAGPPGIGDLAARSADGGGCRPANGPGRNPTS